MTETTQAQGAPRSLLAFLREGRAETRTQGSTGVRRRNVKHWIALGMLLIIPMIAILGVFGSGSAFAADDDDDSMQFSFYKVASSTTAFFSTIQEPGSGNTFDPKWQNVIKSPAEAGSLLGYADPDFSSVSGWLASKLSGSSDAIGYDTLLISNGDSGHSGSNYEGMVNYAYFGAALKGMGLDSSSTGLSLGFLHVIAGGIVMLGFILGGAVDFVFDGVVSVLGLLNPFKLFYVGVHAVSPSLADGMTGGNADVGPLSGVANFIGGWYQVLTALSWNVMVPLFIAVLVFSLFLFKKMDRGGAFKKIVTRILFIGIGLPLLGSMYTGMINSMADASSSGNTGSARVVLSTYVDFEGWVMNSRLAVPDGAVIEWDPTTDSPSGKAQAQVRNTALAVNNWTHGMELSQIVSGDADTKTFAQQVMAGRTQDRATSAKTFATTVDMLVRYMGGAQVSGASFETISKGDLTQSDYYQGHGDEVKGWFADLTQSADKLNGTDPSSNPLVSVQSGKGLKVSGSGDDVHKYTSNVSSCSGSGTQIASTNPAGAPRSCNLSPLAMYNYLNTDFGSTSMKMYSSSSVASEATRSIHNSVDQVGTGTMSFLYWINAVVLLGSFVFIGIGYAFALLFGSIRRSFQILTAVPFATLGALAAIAKVVVYSIALILEVILTIFTYKIVQEFLTSLPQLVEMPFSTILNNGKTGAMATFVTFLTGGWGYSLVITLLSIIGVVGFTVLAIRVRKSVVKAMEEAVTKLVEKFMDTGVGMPTGGKLGPALAGGLASGAGAAAANRMVTGGKGPSSALTAPKKNGPEAVSTAGGIATGPGPQDGGEGQLSITADGGPADGNGDQGNPVGALPGGDGGDAVSKEVALGRDVEVNGLSKPGDEVRGPQVSGDALDAASDSVDNSAAGYRTADQKKLEAGKDGAQAVGQGAIALGRGAAGDYKGAAESGTKAVQAGGEAVAKTQEAKQLEQDASRSKLDQPRQRDVQAGAIARRVSNTAGAANQVVGGNRTQKGPARQGGAIPMPGPTPRVPLSPPARKEPAASVPKRMPTQAAAPTVVPAPPKQPSAPASATPRPTAGSPKPVPAPGQPQAPKLPRAQQAPRDPKSIATQPPGSRRTGK